MDLKPGPEAGRKRNDAPVAGTTGEQAERVLSHDDLTTDLQQNVSVDPHAPASSTASPFPPIADYGFLSDCHVNALIAPSGAVEWLCLPRPDSPSVVAAVLDRSAGSFRVGPEDVTIPAGRRYVPGTNVLETTWQTPTGWLLVHDFLAVGPWYHVDHRSNDHRRAPEDWDAEHMLVRTVRCLQGEVQVTLECEPVFDYGRRDGCW